MQLHDIITLYYTFIHIVPFDLLIFYLFRKNLRLSIQKTALGYSLQPMTPAYLYGSSLSMLSMMYGPSRHL